MSNNLAQYAETVMRTLRGEPNMRLSKPGKELRYGSRGSLAVDLEKGTIYDHEAAEGWGLLDFIRLETGERNPLAWMEAQGIKEPANGYQSPAKVRKQIVATYDYADADGVLVYQVVRYEPKDFRQRRPDPSKPSGWNWSVKGVQPLPYRLPDMLAKPDAPVFVVEGEKDADNLAAQGVLATCNSGGSKKWPDSLSTYFEGRRVVIIPDNDQAGRDHAQTVAAKLHRAGAASVKTLELPNLPQKGDVSDWLSAGGTREALFELAASAPAWEPESLPAPEQLPAEPEPVQDVHSMPTINSWPHMSDKGRPLNTLPNLQHLLNHYGITCRYNGMTKDMEINVPGQTGSADNRQATALNVVLSLAGLNGLPKTDIQQFILNIADGNQYNPAAEWITSRPWDGQDRLQALADTLTTAPGYDPALRDLLLRRWLISAVAAACKPEGFFSKGVLVLQGPQSAGKTAWLKRLVAGGPSGMFKEGALLNPADRDSVKTCISHWLVEIGEVDATFRKADIAALKAFITRDEDELFLRYGRVSSTFPRRTVFAATVNEDTYLKDETGNTRWWTIALSGVNYQHDLDMQQVWAQVFELYRAGERWWLNREEEQRLEGANARHKQVDTVEERIRTKYAEDAPESARRQVTATQVLLEIGIDRPTNGDAQRAARVLRQMFGNPKRMKGRTLYSVPEPLDAAPY